MIKLIGRGLSGGRRQAQLVPQARMSGPVPWVMAIMVALMTIAAAGGLALHNTARAAASELAGGITVQIIDARPDERARQAAAALAVLRGINGVSDMQIVPQDELDALVEPWLGGDGSAADVPVPALIDARLAGPITRARLAGLQRELRAVAPAARVDAQSTWLRPVFRAIGSLQLLAAVLIVLLSAATVAAVLLASRSALGSNRETIEIVHLLGGSDSQIARLFQRSIAIDAAWGSAAGLIVATVVIALLGSSFAALQSGIVTGAALAWTDWVLLVLLPVTAVLIATLTARLTVMRALRGML
ncbi:MAG: cell division protein [Pseudomonadota bacterium]